MGAAQGIPPRDQAQGGPHRHMKAWHGADSTCWGIWGAGCHPCPAVCQPCPVKLGPHNNDGEDGEHPSHWDPYALFMYLSAQQVLVGTDTESLCAFLVEGTRGQLAAYQLRDLG